MTCVVLVLLSIIEFCVLVSVVVIMLSLQIVVCWFKSL